MIEFHEAEVPKATRRPYVRKAPNTTSLCPNCNTRFEQAHSRDVYCGAPCKSQADVVRYMRSVRRNYGDNPPDDVKYAIQIQIAFMLAGGYPKGERTIHPTVREAVKDRDNNLCVLCGAPGEEIDHIDGNNSDADNLRLLCRDCHHTITQERLGPLPDDDIAGQVRLMETLIRGVVEPPSKPCDVDDWSSRWQTWLRDNREPSNK